ncbi:LacI family DNA-binding transcriptional regulator [Asaia platycodi]|uniref:LacI family DNA-binding transcriptional regulator n=1 Tax=Asaia platycodi TaxID=610243 RepID=UPI00046FE03D|nr:LacI family DNA-binding transcriptional regulator [Asaia platycodi]
MKKPAASTAVSLLAVAKEAGVSRATASLVLRNSPLVAEPTRERVKEAMQRLGYIYNRGAANLRQNRTGTIGLVLSNIANPFFSTLTAGVEQANDTSEAICLIANTAESPERQNRQIRRLREHNVDGLIICPAIGSDQALIDELERLGLPYVQVLREIPNGRGDVVTADYAAGIEQAMAHLVETGRKRIVFIGSMEMHSAALARLDGYTTAIRRLGLTSMPVIAGTRDNRYDEEALDRLFASGDPPDAAICYNDIIALSLFHHLGRRGMIVGIDFAVIGMDDLPQAAAAFPSLTTIATMPHRIGSVAAGLLQQRLARPERASERHVITPELVLRDSTRA